MAFLRAVKYNERARVSLIGPAGSGKTYTSLVLARELAGPTGKIAAIDTEGRSMSLYADLFDFDVDTPPEFSHGVWLDRLTQAEQSGYSVFLTDSLSHFWMGEGGALDWVEQTSRKARQDAFNSGWKDFRPFERMMVDRMLKSPCHIICTMRTKTEYAFVTGADGKEKRQKIGLEPVQRRGLEYEFTLCGYLDDGNNIIVDKTRCPIYSDIKYAVRAKPDGEYFRPFVSWLTGHGERPSGAPAVDPQLAWIALSDRYGASGKRDEFTQLLDRYGLALHFTAGRMAEPEILERSREVYRLAMAQIKLLEALAHDAPVPAEPAIHPAVQSATQIAEPPAAPVTPYRGGDDDLPAAMTPAAQGLKPYPPPPSTHIALSIDQLSEFQLGNALNWGKLVNGARFNRAALQRSLASFPGSVADFLDGLAAAAANAVSTPAKGGQ